MFIDKARIFIKAGDGGDGCVAFHREKYVPDGGPDGGDGGRGGDILFVADARMRTLLDFTYKRHFKAQNGAPGKGSNCTGRNAESLTIAVPQGTVVYDEETETVMANLSELDVPKQVLRGGRGGKGNALCHAHPKSPQVCPAGRRMQGRWVGWN
ncbi:MAG: hypothetical protein ACLUO4_05295 [Christensenellales bacterium]